MGVIQPAPMSVLIVDDEAPARARMRQLLATIEVDLPIHLLGEAENAVQARAMVRQLRPQVVLLDIAMPGGDGVSLAREWGTEGTPEIIFCTAYEQHALDAFDVKAVDYLLKPVRAVRLLEALQRAKALSAMRKQAPTMRTHLSVVERGRIHRIPIKEVLYLKADSKYVTIRTESREYLTEESLSSIEPTLQSAFIRVHRSALVARAAIAGVEKDDARAMAGADAKAWVRLFGVPERLPISRRQWPSLKDWLTDRSGERP